MTHITMDEWVKYVTDDVDEATRNEYEMHLYDCDHCMDSYMQAIELAENNLPTVSNPSDYTERILQATVNSNDVLPKHQEPKRVIRKNWYEQKAVHYALAVAMTLLLMATGVFSQLSSTISKFENSTQPSLTESLMNKTTVLINQVEEESKEVE